MDADLLEAIRKSQVADALPEDQDPDELYTTPDDTSGDQEPADQQPAHNPNAQSLSDYFGPPQPVAAATRDITPGVAPPESEYAGVAEEPKVVQPGAVPSALPPVLQPEYAGISPDQEGGAAPDIVPQVERGQLVKLPPTRPVSAASAEVTPGVVPPVTEPAPDTLTQVERATPVSLPPPQPVAQASRELALRAALMKLPPVQPVAQATRELGIAPRAQPVVQPAPGTLAQVERGQLVDSDSDQAQLELASLYGQGVRGTNVPQGTIAQPSAAQPQARARLNPNDQSLEDYFGSQPGAQPRQPRAAQQPAAQPPAAQQPAAQPAQPVTTNPDGSDFPQRVQAVGNNDPAAFITHHTSGRGTVQGVIDTLNHRGLGVQYVMDRNGNIFQTGGPGAQNILTGWGPKGTGLSNENIVGMEIIAKDDKDVTPAQAQSFARFIAARYPNTPIFGHGEVNPGHKEEDEGLTAKAAALAYREQVASGTQPQGDQAARAEPATKGQNGLYAGEKPGDFLTGRASVFATDDDVRSGQDNGVGSPKLGSINTNQAAAVAMPQDALIQAFGNNPAAWRRARVDVVDLTTGKRLRLPIGDLGPRGDLSAIVDQTPFVANYFGGDKTLSVKLVPNAGPDITKNPQLFADEQAAIKQGIDSSSLQAGVQKIQGNLNYQLVSPDSVAHQKLMDADVAQQAQQRQVIAALPEVQKGDVMGAYNRLNNPIPGVSDAMRADAQKNLKTQAIAAMQARFPELRKSDAEAWAQAQSPVGQIMAFGGDVGRQIFANYGKLDVAFNQMMQDADSNRMTQFAKILHPDYTPEGLAAFTKSLTDIQDPAVRSRTIGKLWAGLDPQVQASFDVNGLVTAADNLSSPVYQKAQNEAIETKRQYLDKVAAPDPRLKGTTAEWWAQTIGAIPATVSMAFLPPGIMETAFAAQIYADTKDKVKAAHPDWSDGQVAEMTKNSTIAQLLPQEVLSAISAGTLGHLVERLSGGKLGLDAISGAIQSIDNPALRAVTMAGTHIGAGAGLGTAQQVAANVAEGRPAMEGVPEAAARGAIVGAPGGIIHGVGALRRPEEAAVTPEVRPPVEPPVTGEQPPVKQPPVEQPPVEQPRPTAEPPPRPVTQGELHPDNDIRTGVNPLTGNPQVYLYGREGRRGALPLWERATMADAEALADRLRKLGTNGQYVDPGQLNAAYNRAREKAGQSVDEARETAIEAIFGKKQPAPVSPVPPPAPPPAPQEQPPKVFESASHNMRPLGYRAAVRLPNGEVFSGPEHAHALDAAFANASMRVEDATTQYGFVDKNKHFISMEEADRILEENWYKQRNLPMPGETLPTQEDVARRTYEIGQERAQSGQPGTALDDWTQAQKELSQATEPVLPATVSEAEPINSAIANRYVQERMASGELGQIDPSQGKSTEDMVQQGLQMSRAQRDGLIDNFMKAKGGDLDQQGAAIRSKEALFSEQARAASRAADADPTNPQLAAQAKAAADAVTAFHNGPIKKFKQVWSDSGRVLQREIPLDYTTFNGMKEAYLKGNNKEAPAGLEPKLKQMADAVSKTADAERVAMNNLGKEIENQTRGKTLPTDEGIRTKLMEIMKHLPCPT